MVLIKSRLEGRTTFAKSKIQSCKLGARESYVFHRLIYLSNINLIQQFNTIEWKIHISPFASIAIATIRRYRRGIPTISNKINARATRLASMCEYSRDPNRTTGMSVGAQTESKRER